MTTKALLDYETWRRVVRRNLFSDEALSLVDPLVLEAWWMYGVETKLAADFLNHRLMQHIEIEVLESKRPD